MRWPSEPSRLLRRRSTVVGGALRRFAVCGVVALLLVAAGSIVLAHHIAYEEGSRDAVLQTSSFARGVVAQVAGERLRTGDAEARQQTSEVLSGYVDEGPATHLTLVTSSGRVIWSAGPNLTGTRVHLTPWARSLLASRGAGIGTPLAPGSSSGSAELADVYVGVTDAGGRPLLVVATMPVPVWAEQWHLVEELMPLALSGLLVFAIACGWLAVSLARRVEGGLRRQAVLEHKALLAADLERRRLARDLHDGVIQELSAASYALPLVEDGLVGEPEALPRRTLTVVGDILTRQLTALRTLLMDLYPSRLDDGGLADGLESLCASARSTGLRVGLDAGNADGLRGDDATLVYRVVREGLANVVKHAGATAARVSVRRTSRGVVVRVEDDGRGPGDGDVGATGDGHLGTVLLRDALVERGGTLDLRPADEGGAVLTAWLPPADSTSVRPRRGVSEAAAGH